MKKSITFIAAVLALASIPVKAQSIDSRLTDKTLRIDYVFSGTDKECIIAVDELQSLEGWAGRRTNMKDVPLRGNGQILMTEASSGDTLYRNSFSTLFQEWQATEEATRIRKSFKNVFLLPMPAVKVNVSVQLYDFYDKVAAALTHPVDPEDILIRPKGNDNPSRYIHHSGPSEQCIDVVILAEGYTEAEMDIFYADAQEAADALFSHEPFKSLKDRFNILAVAAPSEDSGVSVPREGDWKNTAVGSHFDTFYSDRYLTTLRLKQLHDCLAGVPYEHIIILANTDTYGGGGIYNSYMLSSTRHKDSKPVIVHEFGHSFAGLADEYFYDDQYEQFYFSDVEPWEPNITTLVDFESKWKDMVEEEGIVTKADQAAQKQAEREKAAKKGRPQAKDWAKEVKGYKVGLYEGAGYLSEGVYRPVPECRMKINEVPGFCPVCERAIRRLINYNTIEQD